jgi:hypothetical protein
VRERQRNALKRERRDQENREDARFQIFSKYRSHGYSSPEEMIKNEPEMAEYAGLDDYYN